MKIRHILQVAMKYGHDSLVLGAVSCGAFTIPGQEAEVTQSIAQAFSEVFNEETFKGRFRHICFAVLAIGPAGQLNFETFQRVFGQASAL